MRYDIVHNASVNFENDFLCKILNKSEPSCLLEMVLSIITPWTYPPCPWIYPLLPLDMPAPRHTRPSPWTYLPLSRHIHPPPLDIPTSSLWTCHPPLLVTSGGHLWRHTPPNRMTDTYENITFSQLRLRELIIFVAISCVGLLLSMRVTNRLTGRERLIRSHSSARFCFELSGNSN